jgi:hypothetical protein
MKTNNRKNAQNKYQKENQHQVKLKINKKTESDILAWILQKDNIQGYIKKLIRKDMEACKKDESV